MSELSVEIGGHPSQAIPSGCSYVGSVQKDGATVGMLIRIEATGVYVQLAGSSFSWLDQGAVSKALQKIQAPDVEPVEWFEKANQLEALGVGF